MMMKSICGVDCTKCELNTTCKGCAETDGQPFWAECIVALYCKKGDTALRELKERLIKEIHGLSVFLILIAAIVLFSCDHIKKLKED